VVDTFYRLFSETFNVILVTVVNACKTTLLPLSSSVSLRLQYVLYVEYQKVKLDKRGLRSLGVTFPPYDSSDAGSNPAEVVEFLRTENSENKSSGRDFKLFDPCSKITAR
jgi:hypothetical protein